MFSFMITSFVHNFLKQTHISHKYEKVTLFFIFTEFLVEETHKNSEKSPIFASL